MIVGDADVAVHVVMFVVIEAIVAVFSLLSLRSALIGSCSALTAPSEHFQWGQ